MFSISAMAANTTETKTDDAKTRHVVAAAQFKGETMTHSELIEFILDVVDALPHASREWLENYIFNRQTHFTRAEIATAIKCTI